MPQMSVSLDSKALGDLFAIRKLTEDTSDSAAIRTAIALARVALDGRCLSDNGNETMTAICDLARAHILHFDASTVSK